MRSRCHTQARQSCHIDKHIAFPFGAHLSLSSFPLFPFDFQLSIYPSRSKAFCSIYLLWQLYIYKRTIVSNPGTAHTFAAFQFSSDLAFASLHSGLLTAMASVKVFGSPMSAEVARVLMCLFEKDVEFQLIRVDAYHGVKRMPQYLKLQPRGEALTFEDDNLTLSGKL